MNAPQRDGLRLIAHGLQYYRSVSSGELMARLVGPLSREEAWDVIAEAQKMGMIEPIDTPARPIARHEQKWSLVRGFDASVLETPA